MKVEFLIATINRQDISFLNNIFKNIDVKTVNALVINQCIDIPLQQLSCPYENIRIISTSSIGTSVSRNLALQHATGDICTFTDDDLVYERKCIDIIKQNFSTLDSDVITYKTGYINSVGFLKKYSNHAFVHSLYSLLKIGDWEIFFRRESVQGKVLFDEQFGLGCKFPSCEYHIFATDCYKQKLKLTYMPIRIVNHPNLVSTGMKYLSHLEVARGAGFARMLGLKSIPAIFFFALKKHQEYKTRHTFFKEIFFLMSGALKILFKKSHNNYL